MYETFFHLQQRPFPPAVSPALYFPGRTIETARLALMRCLERAEGIGLLVGPSGTGKTLLLQVLAEQLRDQFDVALLTSGHLATRRVLLQAILFELGLPYRGMEEGELRLSLLDHLAPGPKCPNGLVLLVDEAHTLPLRLIEELRMINNLVRQNQPRVRLALAGAPSLEERLASGKLAAFAQRITTRCYLESFDRSETIAYVRAQLTASGGNPDEIFTTDALDAIYRATDGIGRVINQVCDHALVLAYAGGQSRIDATGIEEAWADLQQLPTPWNDDLPPTQVAEDAHSVIEFGVLSDEDDAELIESTDEPMSLRIAAEQLPLIDGSEYMPVSNSTNQIEMRVVESNDPFAESFAEEEVIVNPFKTIDEHLRMRPQVTWTENAFAAQLRPAVGPAPEPVELPAFASALSPQALGGTLDMPLDTSPADDPVLPEDHWVSTVATENVANVWFGSEATLQTAMPTPFHFEPSAINLEPAPSLVANNDELMIVEEDEGDVRSANIKVNPVVRRREYRQLFAQLRNNS